MTAINPYDEYGIPSATNQGTFQYAGMLWLSRAGLYAPTFRAYGAHLGRFNQTDPIGMAGGVNLYAYVLGDPVNLIDPLGLDRGLTKIPCEQTAAGCGTDIIVNGLRHPAVQLGVYDIRDFFGPRFDVPANFDPSGGTGGDNSQQEEENCKKPPFNSILSNPKVQAQIKTAVSQAVNTPNQGIRSDIPAHGSEVAFNVLQFGNAFTYVGETYTDRMEHTVEYQRSLLAPFASSVTDIHVHESPTAAPGLSPQDLNVANHNINVVAVTPSGRTFCATGH
jgi:RHS repeat-associated protein